MNNKEIKISIIMPVYNSEKYLSEAIESILSQSFNEFELLLVNDGSTDGSGVICDSYQEKDSRIKVIHKENGGICSARNAGLRIAKGEYITFCDNDDIFLPGLLEDNYKIAKDNDVDLMRYSRSQRITDDKGKVFQNHIIIPDTIISDGYSEQYDVIRCSNAVWNALYRRSIISDYGIRFPEKMRFGNEDLAFNLQILPYCKTFGFNSKVYYIWEMRKSHSTTAKFSINYFSSLYKCMRMENSYIDSLDEDVNSVIRSKILVEQYIYPMCQHLNYKSSSVSKAQKNSIMSRFQNQNILNRDRLLSNKKLIFRNNKKIFIIALLFLYEKYSILRFLLRISDIVYYPFRFK